MRVAIVHYHLRRGGVTRVIENAVAALGPEVECVVLSGEAYAGDALPKVVVVDGLGYRKTAGPDDPARLAANLRSAARDALGGEPDLWHIHNHSLGKNVAFPAALTGLLCQGQRALLQIHDFAEDGRPANYAAQQAFLRKTEDAGGQTTLYPSAPQIHYAALNARDARILRSAGVPADRCHTLPNAVSVPKTGDDPADPLPGEGPLFLYPTRAIRRKNIGEVALYGAVAAKLGRSALFATTLAPENPDWKALHEEWVAFARAHSLPVRFGLGDDPSVSFPALIHRAEALMTTSVAEGFGLAFLEPWLFGKGVCGRNLPEITADFGENGVRLDGLYARLPVCLNPREEKDLLAALEKGLAAAFAAYDRTLPSDALERTQSALQSEEGYDFGGLPEPLQRAVIERVLSQGPTAALEASLPTSAPARLIESNRAAISSKYSLDAYGGRLRDLYKAILNAPASAPGAHSAETILDRFLSPERFSLLRQ
ncbi:MAG: glycosyltransferase family 4 protein [Opitutales bacterium]|nr:glycosyltransferase family 4 protein [Opitutales bacterium]